MAGLLSEAEGREDSTAGSRVAAWAHLGKHLHLFEDKTVFDGKLTIEVVKFGGDATDDLQPHDEPNYLSEKSQRDVAASDPGS